MRLLLPSLVLLLLSACNSERARSRDFDATISSDAAPDASDAAPDVSLWPDGERPELPPERLAPPPDQCEELGCTASQVCCYSCHGIPGCYDLLACPSPYDCPPGSCGVDVPCFFPGERCCDSLDLCEPRVCSVLGACPPSECAPTEGCNNTMAEGLGGCPDVLGWKWSSSEGCVEVRGCGCDGRSCPSLWATEAECEAETGDCALIGAPCGAPDSRPCERERGHFCDYPDGTMCGADGTPGVCTVRPGFCDPVDFPVCGCDGRTYMNDCFAHVSNTDAHTRGPCE